MDLQRNFDLDWFTLNLLVMEDFFPRVISKDV